MAKDNVKSIHQSRAPSAPIRATAPLPTGESMCLDEDEFSRLIAESAYYKAEQRGFEPGHEIEDWLEAEAEVRASLDSSGG